MSEILDKLSLSYGIQTEYQDIWGNRHPLTEQTKRLLLAAMGLAVDDEQQAGQALVAVEQRDWSCTLPPVLVLRQGDGLRVPLTLPGAVAGDTIVRWELQLEVGQRERGEVRLDQLDELDWREVQGQARVMRLLELPASPACGYHRLELRSDGGEVDADLPLIVAPPSCYQPPALDQGRRVWGPTVQLYGVRSRRNWGVGDFTDLRQLAQSWGAAGASLVGLNPMHALFPHNPRHASPYCPSSRLMVNVGYLDLEAMDDFGQCPQARQAVAATDFQARLAAAREQQQVDYAGAAGLKRPVLEQLYAHFREHHLDRDADPRGAEFRAFQAAGAQQLRSHCLYEALQEHFYRLDNDAWGWPVWPQPYRDAASAEVAAFCEQQLERVEFFEYLQWQVDQQLGAAARAGEEHGLELGLYLDLSVSVDRAGSEVWANRDVFAMDASVGAPPDALGPQGQNWGLPPLIPHRLREVAYAPLVAVLRRTMRHAGALRIDHVMGLMRLFWIPAGMTPAEGAYVHYPLHDLLAIVALESQRNRCLVIGEDLGTVPDEVRQALGPAGVLSYRLLYFERHGDAFKAPADYPRQALVAVTTHDLPTLAGYWTGEDLRVRDELSLYPDEEVRREFIEARGRDRRQLLQALEREGLLPGDAGADPAAWSEMTAQLVLAVHRFLARSPAQVMVVQLEDLLGQLGQANLPGTTDEHPNWLRRLPVELERQPQLELVQQMARALARERR